MDRQYSKVFFKSLVDAMQRICREFLDFEQSVELYGCLSLDIDNTRKERYVLSELLQNSGDVISESYCTKAFRTIRKENSHVHQTDENTVPRSSATPTDTASEVPVTQGAYQNPLPVHSKSGRKHKQNSFKACATSQVFATPMEQFATPNEFARHYSKDVDPVPVQLFTSVTASAAPPGRLGRKCTQLKVPSFESLNVDQSKMAATSSKTAKRKSAADTSTGVKRTKASTPQASPPGSSRIDVPHPQDAEDSFDSFPIVVKEEGVPCMVIRPETDACTGEGTDQEVSCPTIPGDPLLQFPEAATVEEMSHNTSRKTRGHVKLFQTEEDSDTDDSGPTLQTEEESHADESGLTLDHTLTNPAQRQSSSVTPGKKRNHLCQSCGQQFSSAQNLRSHQRTKHENSATYRCDICEKSFMYKHQYEGHMNTHMKIKPFQCSVCNKQFAYPNSLKIHQKTCSLIISDNPPKFECDQCPKVFTRQKYLKEHVRSLHSNTLNYRCKCGKRYRHRSSLKKHRAHCMNQQ